jgi:hypothetical protein
MGQHGGRADREGHLSEFRDGAWWHRQPDDSLLRWDTGTNAWVPAGPEGPVPEAVSEPWQPLASRATAAKVLLIVIAVISLIAAISDAMEIDLLTRIQDGEQVSVSEADSNDTRQGIIGIVQTALFIATVVVFLMWFSRAYQNLERLGAGALRYKRGWAIGAWFVPFLNLVRPKQIANDIWRGSDPDLAPGAANWRDGPIPGLLFGFWWLLWLVTNFAVGPGIFGGGESIEELRNQSTRFLVSDAAEIGAALLCALVVTRTTSRQEERARRVAAATAAA